MIFKLLTVREYSVQKFKYHAFNYSCLYDARNHVNPPNSVLFVSGVVVELTLLREYVTIGEFVIQRGHLRAWQAPRAPNAYNRTWVRIGGIMN
jgi:hypothetical protein